MRPLDPFGSIKIKLGVLVAATITVAAVLAVAGTGAGLTPYLTIPVAVLVALAVTQLLARGMTSPLREMTAAARVMATGDYSRRVTATSRDEVGQLARAFNTMAADLEAVDRQRRELVANVSHELRTPVTALQAVLENLVDGVATPGTDRLKTALAQTERLGRLVADLLDLSRADAGITPLNRSRVAVRAFLHDAVREARLADRPVRFSVDVRPFEMVVYADRSRLHQLVANLLDNASRHSPRGGTVHVLALQSGHGMVLEVADSGPGIALADRGRVFERFSTDGSHDGGGLGLSIARWVTDLHGGTIEVVDDPADLSPLHPAGAGCRIRVTVPDEAMQ
ncbi:MAG TPA: ATP-binding protein [Nocardioidaceae bacterium]|nr:ATP-binding protein [Nocardioidaceae bacterium]